MYITICNHTAAPKSPVSKVLVYLHLSYHYNILIFFYRTVCYVNETDRTQQNKYFMELEH